MLRNHTHKQVISFHFKKYLSFHGCWDALENAEVNLEALQKRLETEKRAVEQLQKKVSNREDDEEVLQKELQEVHNGFSTWNQKMQFLFAEAKDSLMNFIDNHKESRERMKEINEELEQCTSKLSNARADQYESKREQRAKEVLEQLKRMFPGVHGRLADLMKPNSRR